VAELELGRGSLRRKILCVIMKLHPCGQDRVRNGYEWQMKK